MQCVKNQPNARWFLTLLLKMVVPDTTALNVMVLRFDVCLLHALHVGVEIKLKTREVNKYSKTRLDSDTNEPSWVNILSLLRKEA